VVRVYTSLLAFAGQKIFRTAATAAWILVGGGVWPHCIGVNPFRRCAYAERRHGFSVVKQFFGPSGSGPNTKACRRVLQRNSLGHPQQYTDGEKNSILGFGRRNGLRRLGFLEN
jgi:hypothetical protein